MTMNTGFRGTAGGSVQTAYSDQPGRGVPGMLAFASDINNTDAYAVALTETNGVAAGAWCVAALDPDAATTDAFTMQAPNLVLNLPVSGSALADLVMGGIVVFSENMQSNESGVPGWGPGRFARVARPKRSGMRMWVVVKETVTAYSSAIRVVTAVGSSTNTAALGWAAGDMVVATLAGSSAAGYSVDVSSVAQWVTSAVGTTTNPALAMIEFI